VLFVGKARSEHSDVPEARHFAGDAELLLHACCELAEPAVDVIDREVPVGVERASELPNLMEHWVRLALKRYMRWSFGRFRVDVREIGLAQVLGLNEPGLLTIYPRANLLEQRLEVRSVLVFAALTRDPLPASLLDEQKRA
jgi:hypothetical protein